MHADPVSCPPWTWERFSSHWWGSSLPVSAYAWPSPPSDRVSNIMKEVVLPGVMFRVEANSMIMNMMGMEWLESRMLELLTARRAEQMEEERRVCCLTKRLAMEEHWREKRLEWYEYTHCTPRNTLCSKHFTIKCTKTAVGGSDWAVPRAENPSG